MSTTQFKRAVLDHMNDVLRPSGFRKSGSTFSRPLEEVVQLIQLQASTSSTATMLRVTVNVAVWVPALGGVYGKPDVADAHWSPRLGALMTTPRADKWRQMASVEEANAAAREIADALRTSAMPALGRVATHADLIALWRSGSPGCTKGQAEDRLRRLLQAKGRS